ncbi:MAG: SRPBCC family protein [Acidimicrobiales bacterium]
MRKLSTRVRKHISAVPHDIWAYRLDFLHLPEYNPSVKRIERLSDNGSGGSGARYRFDLQRGDRSYPIDLTVTRSIPSQLVAISLGGELPAEEELTIATGDASGSRGGPASTTTGRTGCLVTISLTLLVPDSFPPTTDHQLLDAGSRQMAGELDAMAIILEAAPGTPSLS